MPYARVLLAVKACSLREFLFGRCLVFLDDCSWVFVISKCDKACVTEMVVQGPFEASCTYTVRSRERAAFISLEICALLRCVYRALIAIVLCPNTS